MALGRKNDVNFRMGLDSSRFQSGARDVSRSVKRMNSDFTRFYRGLRTGALYSGIAILARELAGAAKELIILGEKVKNVSRAFESLADPGLLDKLKKATGRMVSDFTLMQTSVQFINFGMSQNQLPNFLKFAQKRALQAGESIDHLVESIVKGLGRKSIKVIDNLSLNVERFKEIVIETGSWTQALGTIIEEDMGKGTSVVTDQVLLLGTAWENLKAAMSPRDTDLKWLADILDTLTKWEKANDKIDDFYRDMDIDIKMDRVAIAAKKAASEIAKFEGNPEFTKALAFWNKEYDRLLLKSIKLAGGHTGKGIEVFSGPSLTGFVEPGETAEEKAARIAAEEKAERELLAIIRAKARAEERRLKALRDILSEIQMEADLNPLGISDADVKKVLAPTLNLKTEIEQMTDLFAPPEDLAEEWFEVTSDIENNWVSSITSMIRAIEGLARKTKIEFKDIAGILLSVVGLVASGGVASGIGGIIGALFGNKKTGGMASGMTLVGEAGPELVNFSQPARVHSAPATQRLLGLGGGGGGEVVFHISGDSLVGVLNQKQSKKEYFG